MSGPPRILMLGLDAVDHDVLQRLIAAGRLPNLAALARSGAAGRLDSPAALYAGGVWPTFYTGRPVADHGVFHNKQWRPETMRVEVPTDRWTQAEPFWEAWRGTDIDSVIVDVPMVLGQPRPLKGVYLGGWGTHDLIARGSWPTSLWRDLERRFGPPLMPREDFGRQTEASLAALAATLRQATAQMRDLAMYMLEQHPWQFACIVFGAAHRAGHYLWDRSQVASRAAVSAAPDESLLGIYDALDEAVGAVLHRVPDETLVVAFAVHGMGPNPGWSDLLPGIIARMETLRSGEAPARGLLYRLKQAVPHHWVRPILHALPTAATERLVELWSRRMYDWSRTRHFPVPMDEAGYLRLSLRGRERDGIIEPGSDYDRQCDELETLVASLRDESTGQPLAGPALRAFRAAAGRHGCARLLPDLIFPWHGPAAMHVRRVVSAAVPGFSFATPDRLPSGRSGNHRGVGWFIARGPGVRAGTTVTGHHVIDLLPTIAARLGRGPEARLPGRPIVEVAQP